MISWLILFGEIIAVYSENHTKPINALCGKNAELLNVEAGDTYSSYHCALKSLEHFIVLSLPYEAPVVYERYTGLFKKKFIL
jgi:hypothetical protein